MPRTTRRQEGFVSILTVLFFMTLVSVITVSFTRFMIQERRQELEDEMTKSAYTAALAGIEDAKQAMAYCASSAVSDADKPACRAALYKDECPGFNSAPSASPYFTAAGIPKSTNGRTSITGENVTTAPQGYSCVIVTKDTTSLEGQASPLTSSGTMFELRTTSAYRTIRVYWQEKGLLGLPGVLSLNPRLADWGALNESWPAVLRVGIISVPTTTPFTIGNITQQTSFVYPTNVGTAASLNPAAMPARTATRCDLATNTSDYRCYVDLVFSSPQTGSKYILLHSLYRTTDYQIVAYDTTTPTASSALLSFDGVQPSIDSTGYTSGVSRRVMARVHPGGLSLNTGTAVDTGFALCKNFSVGASSAAFVNLVQSRCIP